MINFQNSPLFKLKAVNNNTFANILSQIIVNGEQVLGSYKTVRDGVVFTNKRVIAINVQGVTGKKVDVTSLPYSRLSAYSCETAGVFDMDSELELWFDGLGKIRFEFSGNTNISEINRAISIFTLQ